MDIPENAMNIFAQINDTLPSDSRTIRPENDKYIGEDECRRKEADRKRSSAHQPGGMCDASEELAASLDVQGR